MYDLFKPSKTMRSSYDNDIQQEVRSDDTIDNMAQGVLGDGRDVRQGVLVDTMVNVEEVVKGVLNSDSQVFGGSDDAGVVGIVGDDTNDTI